MLKKNILKLFFISLIFISSSSLANIVQELTDLNNLFKEGAISEEEFQKAKDIIFKKENTDINKNSNINNQQIKKQNADENKTERNFEEDLSATFINLNELEELGEFQKNINFPQILFEGSKSQSEAAKEALQKMYKTFVQNKNLMEKNPEDIMKGMAYFEIFYNQELYDKRKIIENFRKKYPNVTKREKNKIKSLYSLNQAKQSMRKAMGLSMEDTIDFALKRYVSMSEFFEPAEKVQFDLNGDEKKLKNSSRDLKKYLGSFKKNIELKSQKRIDSKEFNKEFLKNKKKIEKVLDNLISIDEKSKNLYSISKDVFDETLKFIDQCRDDCNRPELLTAIDGIDFLNHIISDGEYNIIKKQYSVDMSTVDIDSLSEDKKNTLSIVSSNLKSQKVLKDKKLHKSVVNLVNNNFTINSKLTDLENSGFTIKSIPVSFDKIENMSQWNEKDWANSWKGDIPKEIKDKSGNLITFSEENINDLKAQLAISTFSEIIDLSNKDLKETINENVQELAKAIQNSNSFDLQSWLNQDFSITLDNYSRLLGNSYGVEMNNFSDLTRFANNLYGTNMSPDEYASAWQNAILENSTSSWENITKGVDLLNTVSAFEAGSIAREIGADLQTVADSVALAASVGVSTDLEALASGLGYSSFADAVAAYNAQYGTNYTEDEAREALGN